MDIEYEATFPNINKDEVRKKLKRAEAKLLRPGFFKKSKIFNLPKGHKIKGSWLRVRNEGDKVTLSLKIVDGEKIANQKEICLMINNFAGACELLKTLGCTEKALHENKRELWTLDGVEITIDEWPFLEPFIEIEGKSEKQVKEVARKLGFNYQDALFGSVDTLYSKKYNLSKKIINDQTPKIIFNMKNPFIK